MQDINVSLASREMRRYGRGKSISRAAPNADSLRAGRDERRRHQQRSG
jgi:hypothetical protein